MKKIVVSIMILGFLQYAFSQDEISWDQFINQKISDYQKWYDSEPNETTYRKDYFSKLVRKENYQIVFEEILKDKDKEIITGKGVLVYFNGYIFIKIEKKGNFKKYNYVTLNDGVYSWVDGETTGTIFVKDYNENFNFLLSEIDISFAKPSFLDHWIKKDDVIVKFTTDDPNYVIFKSKEAMDNFITIGVTLNPFWCKDLMMKNNDTTYIFRTYLPITIDKLPDGIQDIPNIKWVNNNSHLASRIELM